MPIANWLMANQWHASLSFTALVNEHMAPARRYGRGTNGVSSHIAPHGDVRTQYTLKEGTWEGNMHLAAASTITKLEKPSTQAADAPAPREATAAFTRMAHDDSRWLEC